ncbi:MAG: ATP-binding protein [Planctomycetes bacterium]|nr:ATP-binding protein [Planctomycetota bacterium]
MSIKIRVFVQTLISKNQKQLIELQHKRISTGLKQQRQQIIEENQRRINQKRRRVVGQRPIDVANYFRNRQREQEEIGRLLAAPSTRLVSVVGRGGMGKTALASKVLSDLERNRWPHTDGEIPVDGIVYLSTRTAGISLERLFIYCARMLGGKQEEALIAVWTNPKITTGDKVSLLLETLSQGLYVILMDNIEDLLDDDGQIIDEDLQIFFEKCFVTLHNARLLVTSRIRLAFRHEVMRFDYQVPLLEGLPTEDGVALLRELDPNGIHGLREASDKKLIKVIELVHGVPRAIEVFAGILANDPFANLDEVLQQFYGRDDVVQDLIEEGYKRLDNNACRVMEALSVFGCPVPVLAVDYLLEPFVPALDVPAIARRLTRTHFVSINRGSKTLSLHPIDRDYAYSQLPEEGDYNKKALERRAAKYYAQCRAPKEAWQTIDDLEPQLAEFEHLVKGEDYDAAAPLMNEIDAEYLSLWGYAQRVSNMRKKLLDKITDRELEISNLCKLGGAHLQLGQYKEAINYFKQALEIAREIGNKNEGIRSLVQLGHSHENLGEHEYAIECQQQALALARKIGDQQAEWQALDKLGVIYRNKGLPDKTIQYCQNALVITQQIGNRQGEGSVMENLGIAYRNMKHFDKAHDHLQLALKIAQEVVNRKAEARAFIMFLRWYAQGKG